MRHTPGSLATLVIVGVLAVAAVACSSPSRQVTKKIQANLQQQLHLADRPPITCPSGPTGKKGETFTCVVTIAGQHIDAHVTFTANNRFDATFGGTVPTPKELANKLRTDTSARSVDCGAQALLVITPSHPVVCTATGPNGIRQKIQVGYKGDKLDYQPIEG